MMAWLTAQLAGKFGVWILAGGIAAAAIIGAGGIYLWKDRQVLEARNDAAEIKAHFEAERADNNAKVVTDLKRILALADTKTAEGNDALDLARLQSTKLMEKIDALPKTSVCPRTPVMRTYLDGLRARSTGGPH